MKIKYLGFYLFAFVLALPLPLNYSAIALLAMIFNSLIYYKSFKYKTSTWVVLSILFVVIDPIRSLLFESFSFSGLAETKLSFLIVPIIFLNIREILYKQQKYILRFFVAGVFVYVLYAIGYMIYFYITYTNYTFSFTDSYIMYMLYNYLPGAYHHTYIGIYMAFANVILAQEVMLTHNKYRKTIIIALLFIIFFMQIYIGSKMTMIISFLSLIFFFIFKVVNKNKLKVIIASLIAVFFTLSFIIKDWLLISIKNSLGHRIQYMQESLSLLKENPFIGVGLKNIKNNTIELSGETKMLIPHNLYVHESLSNGIFGLLLIMYMFYYLFKKGSLTKDILFLTFVFMCFLLGFTEDFLYLQRGVFFFLFFATLFLSSTSTQKAI